MRRASLALGATALLAVLAIGLSQAGTHSAHPVSAAPSAAQIRAELAGSPPPLASLHAQPSALLGGGVGAVRARLESLRGFPVVVNKWASWCGPCRAEFPLFQRLSVRLGRRVAFLGLDAGDNAGDARGFLTRFPISYPSYTDPDEHVARALGATVTYPQTLFYDRRGRLAYQHQGQYPGEAALAGDIQRYVAGA